MMGQLKAGQMVEVCSQRAENNYPVKKRDNGKRIYLAELDGCEAKVLYPGVGGNSVVHVKTESNGRSGKMTLPDEVLKPLEAK